VSRSGARARTLEAMLAACRTLALLSLALLAACGSTAARGEPDAERSGEATAEHRPEIRYYVIGDG